MEWDDKMMDDELRRQAAIEQPYAQRADVWKAIQRKRQGAVVKWYAAAAAVLLIVLISFPGKDSDALIELKAELQATAVELSSINQQIELFGNDDQLLRARTRIQHHRTAVLKAITETN